MSAAAQKYYLQYTTINIWKPDAWYLETLKKLDIYVSVYVLRPFSNRTRYQTIVW
jgi:hypothetical protein